MKEHGRFQAGGLWMDGMQIPGIDEIKTLLLYVISLHIDIQFEVDVYKRQGLDDALLGQPSMPDMTGTDAADFKILLTHEPDSVLTFPDLSLIHI